MTQYFNGVCSYPIKENGDGFLMIGVERYFLKSSFDRDCTKGVTFQHQCLHLRKQMR